jgi:hypothetical protein
MSERQRLTYAGIGARRTPADALGVMEALADRLAQAGWTLRSGGADGADSAFEGGAAIIDLDLIETYRTDCGWSGCTSLTPDGPTREAYELAAGVHPAWSRCSEWAKALHARNSHEILGPDLDDPVCFVVCWTPDGSLDGANPNSGGTGQALRVARIYSVPVFNLFRTDHRRRIEHYL